MLPSKYGLSGVQMSWPTAAPEPLPGWPGSGWVKPIPSIQYLEYALADLVAVALEIVDDQVIGDCEAPDETRCDRAVAADFVDAPEVLPAPFERRSRAVSGHVSPAAIGHVSPAAIDAGGVRSIGQVHRRTIRPQIDVVLDRQIARLPRERGSLHRVGGRAVVRARLPGQCRIEAHHGLQLVRVESPAVDADVGSQANAGSKRITACNSSGSRARL